MKPTLFVGNRNYSSWSLRPWLCLKWAGLDFSTRDVELDQPGYGAEGIAEIKAISPSGKVPALELKDGVIWDSLAIAEWAAEQNPGALLPDNPIARAQMRSAVAEMHSGFPALRRDLAMNIRRRCQAHDLPADTLRDLARLEELWLWCLGQHSGHGPYLFGKRSMADAFYLPVVTRLRTYGIAMIHEEVGAYAARMLRDEAFLEWEAGVLSEPARIFSRAPIDSLYAE